MAQHQRTAPTPVGFPIPGGTKRCQVSSNASEPQCDRYVTDGPWSRRGDGGSSVYRLSAAGDLSRRGGDGRRHPPVRRRRGRPDAGPRHRDDRERPARTRGSHRRHSQPLRHRGRGQHGRQARAADRVRHARAGMGRPRAVPEISAGVCARLPGRSGPHQRHSRERGHLCDPDGQPRRARAGRHRGRRPEQVLHQHGVSTRATAAAGAPTRRSSRATTASGPPSGSTSPGASPPDGVPDAETANRRAREIISAATHPSRRARRRSCGASSTTG